MVPFGLIFIANSADSSAGNQITDIKAWFIGNSIDFCHDYHGNVTGVSWSLLGYDGYIAYDVLIDRDKMVRLAGRGASGALWQTTMQEISGAI